MELTIEQFLKQNKVWRDEYYYYAIHETDGGARYLYQVEIDELKFDNIEEARYKKIHIYRQIRLDGSSLNDLIESALGFFNDRIQ